MIRNVINKKSKLGKDINVSQEFTLELDEEAISKFEGIMNNEGLMRAGFIIHESNNEPA